MNQYEEIESLSDSQQKQLLRKAKHLEQVKKGKGKLYKTPKDRQIGWINKSHTFALDTLSKAVITKRISPKQQPQKNVGKSSEIFFTEKTKNDDGDAYMNLVTSHNSHGIISTRTNECMPLATMVDVKMIERSPSRIELSDNEQRKLIKLLEGIDSLMPYDDRDVSDNDSGPQEINEDVINLTKTNNNA